MWRHSLVASAGFIILANIAGIFLSQSSAFAAKDIRDNEGRCGVLDFLPWNHDWNAHHYADPKVEKAAELMSEAGVAFVRMDFLWSDIEPKQGVFDFQKYDRIVDILSKKNISILGLLNYNNDGWASENWNDAPDHARYIAYAKAVVERYKNKVKYWEIWNEPNYDVYWKPQDGMKSYTRLLKALYPELKKIDPTCVIVLGGMAGNAALGFDQVYSHGGKNFFDVANFHPFTSPVSDPQMEKAKKIHDDVYEVMLKYHDENKEIWLTEIGCPGVPDSEATQDWWMGKNPDEQTQSHWVGRVMSQPFTWPGVKKVFWAFFRDTPNHFMSGTDYFGLVREDFSKKPSFEVYQRQAVKK